MIPNLIHFVFGMTEDFGGKPFSLVHYLTVRAAFEVNRPDAVFMHCAYMPSGPWWERALPFMTVVHVEAPTVAVSGVALTHPAHRTDFMRLEILARHGGIYLDVDVLCVRPFFPLLTGSPCVLGLQFGGGLCNGVILAEPGAPLIAAWLNESASFRSTGWGSPWWDEFACWVPQRLVAEDPSLARVEPEASFHYPSWGNPAPLYDPSDLSFSEAYCHHLWEAGCWDRWLRDLTPDAIRAGASPFARLARRWLDS
jgi:Glycosyltransferase sugar-binding region containing DXD motif